MGEDTSGVGQHHGSEVMAAIDSDGCRPRLVIADLTDDESWLSITATASACLADWR